MHENNVEMSDAGERRDKFKTLGRIYLIALCFFGGVLFLLASLCLIAFFPLLVALFVGVGTVLFTILSALFGTLSVDMDAEKSRLWAICKTAFYIALGLVAAAIFLVSFGHFFVSYQLPLGVWIGAVLAILAAIVVPMIVGDRMPPVLTYIAAGVLWLVMPIFLLGIAALLLIKMLPEVVAQV